MSCSAATTLAVPSAVRLGTPSAARRPSQTLSVAGLSQPVEIRRDRWGINHIYAQNEPDLFFAQGYAAARDRLFQFELWRRQATGTLAEIVGRRELERDRGARLHMFRGDLDAELAHYHPRGKAIIEAFVHGVNAYIAETERTPSLLPHRVQGARHHAGPLDAGRGHLASPEPHRRTSPTKCATCGR